MLVYDITDRGSFSRLQYWYDEMKNSSDPSIVAMLVWIWGVVVDIVGRQQVRSGGPETGVQGGRNRVCRETQYGLHRNVRKELDGCRGGLQIVDFSYIVGFSCVMRLRHLWVVAALRHSVRQEEINHFGHFFCAKCEWVLWLQELYRRSGDPKDGQSERSKKEEECSEGMWLLILLSNGWISVYSIYCCEYCPSIFDFCTELFCSTNEREKKQLVHRQWIDKLVSSIWTPNVLDAWEERDGFIRPRELYFHRLVGRNSSANTL